jgi:hypothetical protein
MSFRITGLDPAPFRALFGLDDDALRAHGAIRCRVDAPTGFPDRIELRDAQPGETVLLLNYTHQAADTPFRASHAIFVREGAAAAREYAGEVPEVLKTRVISLRGFSARGMLVDAAVAEGEAIAPAIERLFGNAKIAYLHAHFAAPGCYAARVDRL